MHYEGHTVVDARTCSRCRTGRSYTKGTRPGRGPFGSSRTRDLVQIDVRIDLDVEERPANHPDRNVQQGGCSFMGESYGDDMRRSCEVVSMPVLLTFARLRATLRSHVAWQLREGGGDVGFVPRQEMARHCDRPRLSIMHTALFACVSEWRKG